MANALLDGVLHFDNIQVWLLIIDNVNAINIARLPEDELAALLLIFWVIRRIYPLSLSIASNVTTFPFPGKQ